MSTSTREDKKSHTLQTEPVRHCSRFDLYPLVISIGLFWSIRLLCIYAVIFPYDRSIPANVSNAKLIVTSA
eukprot:2586656-Amphidinium_carterae.1